MKKKESWILIVLALATLFIVATAVYNQMADKFLPETGIQEETTQEPQKTMAPDFVVYDIDGNEVMLSDFRGKPVVLNFWASWCGPCKGEMPDFQKVYDAYGEEVHFVIVNLTDGRRETVESASQFIEDSGYTFPVYYDSDQHAASLYGLYSVPRTYFIDAEGHLIDVAYGAIDEAYLLGGIEKL